MDQLDDRQRRLLRAVIVEYVQGAEPIASELLAQKYDLGVKGATIRNELAEMSEMGYLEQPHTSAGRIPSDKGYRFYVDHLIVEKSLDETQKRLHRQTSEESEVLLDMLQEVLQILSRATQQLSVATVSRDTQLKVMTALLSAFGPTQALLVIALSNGHVENRLMECPANMTWEDIGTINEALSINVVGKPLGHLIRTKNAVGNFNPSTEKLLGLIFQQIRTISKQLTRGKVITEGEEYLFAKPEFQRESAALTEMFHEMAENELLYESLQPKLDFATIGKENAVEQMQKFSVLRRTYCIGDTEVGVIGLIGPTRMDYDSGLPLVNYTAQALSRSLTKYFGQNL